MAVGAYVIYVSAVLILYFSFRDGLRGGYITTIITVAYYFYIIYTRHYSGKNLVSGIEATAILATIYGLVAGIIGWLKETIDAFIEREADERQRLQSIIQQLPVGIIIANSKGVVEQTNKQLEIILGSKLPRGLVLGKENPIAVEQNGKKLSPEHSPLYQSLLTGKPVKNKEFNLHRPDGKRVYVNVNASVVHNTRGKVIAGASIVNDITQQKDLEVRKDDFVNMASHELKTPVTSLKLYIDALQRIIKKYDDDRVSRTLDNIKNQTERLQELINDLLDVSRLQTGKLHFKKEVFELNALIQEIIEGLQDDNKPQQIRFIDKQHVSVYADRFRIYQVITNLITNAKKYSSEDKDIIVRVKRLNGKAVVSVQDYGIGISKDQHKKIFEKLYQVTDATEKTFPGLGMGLYISKEFIKRHKGTIWVESEKGKGATFYFTLPLQK